MSPTCFVGGQEGPQRAGGGVGTPAHAPMACPRQVGAIRASE